MRNLSTVKEKVVVRYKTVRVHKVWIVMANWGGMPVVEAVCTTEDLARRTRKRCEEEWGALRAWVEGVTLDHWVGDGMRESIRVRLGRKI